MRKQQKIKIQQNQFRASFVPKSYNPEKRTIDITWSTGARVKRFSWEGVYYEELSMKKSHVDLGRLRSGAPVLNNHGTHAWGGVKDLNDILGRVETADIVDGEGVATVRFSKREDIQGLVNDIIDGIIPNISVGYSVSKYEELDEEAEDGAPIFRATQWEPMELSFVAIPADPSAQVRSASSIQQEAILQRKEENTEMKKKLSGVPAARAEGEDPAPVQGGDPAPANESPAGDPVAPEAEGDKEAPKEEPKVEGEQPKVEPEAPKEEPAKVEGEGDSQRSTDAGSPDPKAEEIRQAEIKRGEDIRVMVRSMKLEESFADSLVKNPAIDVDEARKQIFAELQKRNEKTTTVNQRIEVRDMDQRILRREAAVRGLLNRFNPEKNPLKDGDGQFRQGSLIDTARKFLALEGVSDAYDMSRNEVARRALHSTSDFAEVLSGASNVSLRQGYDAAPNTYEPFTAKKNVEDFKEISSVEISNGGTLQKVNEHGEYKRTTLEESAEKYRVEKYGLIIGKTYELMVNDNLGAFTDLPAKLGRRAREKENEIFWSLILANPEMADGEDFFSSAHGNTDTAGAIAVGTVGTARRKMRVQRDLDGEIISGLTPQWLVGPAALETTIDQFVSPMLLPATQATINTFVGKLKGLVEPRLDAGSTSVWYAFADKSVRATAEMALLDGKGPEIFTREGFDIDGMEVKVRYCFGMKLIDYRAAFRNG
jgi:hypothetical protein